MSFTSLGAAVAAALPVFVAALASAQTAPTFTSPISDKQATISGTAQAVSAAYTGVKIFVCTSPSTPGATAPDCSPTGAAKANAAKLVPDAPTGITVTDGKFSVKLATPLVAGQWFWLTEVATDAAGPHPVESAAVPIMTPATPTSPVTAPLSAFIGSAQDSVAPYTEVKVYVCVGKEGTIPTDCSATAATNRAPLANAATSDASKSSYVDVLPTGVFAITLKDPITPGQSFWLTEVGTTATATATLVSPILTAALATRPTINTPLTKDDSHVTGTATVPVKLNGVMVQLFRVKQVVPDRKEIEVGHKYPVNSDGTYTIPANLPAAQTVFVRQSSTDPATPIGTLTDSEDALVAAPLNEREHTDFIGGALLSQSNSSYSQADVFMDLNVDNSFYQPGYYAKFKTLCGRLDENKKKTPGTCLANHHPGLNGFFQTRLTSIPVNSTQTTTVTGNTGTTTPATTTPSYATFLSSQKTAHFEMGLYAPFMFARVYPITSSENRAFFFGPIFRVGFNSLVADNASTSSTSPSGATTITTTQPLGTSSSNTKLYNFTMTGIRLGEFAVEPGSPRIIHYLDIGLGKYSNLRNLYCPTDTSADPTAKCKTGGTLDPTLEAHYTPYRIAIEGYYDYNGFILGFSANIGQKWNVLDHPNVAKNTTVTPAADDLRFLFGYKFDLTQLVSAITKGFPGTH